MTVLSPVFLCSYWFLVAHYTHMFQLNAYKPEVQLRWLVKNKGDCLRKNVLVFLVFLSLPAPSLLEPMKENAFFLLCSLFFLAQSYFNRPRQAKKPLVYTNRVKRMLVTHGIFLAAFLFSLFRAGNPRVQAACLAAVHLLAPVFVLLVNGANTPIEKFINRRYTQDAKRRLRQHPGLIVIGVTGSYGKTSTKFFLHKLLSVKYDVLMTPESFNTTLGVVRTVREELKPFHEVFICEMGARNVGDVAEICEIVKPRYGVLTSIGPQHIESFKSLENVVKAKFELADALPLGDGAAFLNLNNPNIRAERAKYVGRGQNERTVTYGFSDDCDYCARDIFTSGEGSSFSVRMPDFTEVSFETKLIGAHNVENILAAISVADFLGVGRWGIVMGVRKLESVPHRLQLIRRGEYLLIDDAYNSNAAGAKAALDALAMFDGCKILVTPGMIELGTQESELNEKFGTQAGEICDFVVLVGKRQTESIRKGLTNAGYSREKIFVADDLFQGLAKVAELDARGKQKVVLLENDLPDNY
ncbi:MAG: UDP-N-acetylmuramoyl-tripeptide--D-alanyl-D-alanine ligase [Synergistaceae bacterium]|jgi:UDP-N-acetylmuramoyl-tripeptide--D-alanyl-D-alanine ligase|nr:UDP-N-acetylmuramoyl-tripeptide--D-alanyl-D-alanine ligase [Synergistaceae bacterium]